MARDSKIEWTDHTFNPWWGCTKVSPACTNCYAETFSKRVGLRVWGDRADRRFFGDQHWGEPIRWSRQAERDRVRRRVFCASMADVFEDRGDLDPWRARLWSLVDDTPSLDWLLLTKRPSNVTKMVPWAAAWPHNVWLGTTVENQEWAEKRISSLVANPAVVRFLSVEPILGSLDLSRWAREIEWVIVGGESGHHARPSQPAWVRLIRDQCVASGIAFFFKQWGDWMPGDPREHGRRRCVQLDVPDMQPTALIRLGKKAAGRLLDGRTWDEVPSTRRSGVDLIGESEPDTSDRRARRAVRQETG